MLKYHITRLPQASISGGNTMSLLRWQPWSELDTMRRQLDQAFDELTHDAVFKSVNAVVQVPAIELRSTDSEFILKAELPGIRAKDLDIEVTRKAVSLKGEYRQESTDEHQQIHRTELRYGRFQRVIPLPSEVHNTEAKAHFQDGVLTLTLPKLKATEPAAFKVTIGETSATPAFATSDAAPVATDADAPTDATVAVAQSDQDDAWQ